MIEKPEVSKYLHNLTNSKLFLHVKLFNNIFSSTLLSEMQCHIERIYLIVWVNCVRKYQRISTGPQNSSAEEHFSEKLL